MISLYPDRNPYDRERWTALLETAGIRPEASVEEVYGLEEDGALVATASIEQNIIKCVAVDEAHRGGSVFSELLSGILTTLYRRGVTDIFVYTKPDAVRSFEAFGFGALERVDDALVFMERPAEQFTAFLHQLKKSKKNDGINGAIVMNANPFTNGHLHLVTTALEHVDHLHLFILSEEASVFPAAIRRELVQAALAECDRVSLHDTASYLVSQATFPSYFLHEDADITRIHATLDARLFRRHIAPALGITHRFVGEEPFSPPTALYNQVMEDVFAAPDDAPPIALYILPRLEREGHPISASTVRALLAAGDVEAISPLVPTSTMDFLRSARATPILNTLQNDPLRGAKAADARER